MSFTISFNTSISIASKRSNQLIRRIGDDIQYNVVDSDTIIVVYFDVFGNSSGFQAKKDGSSGASAANYNFKVEKNRVWVYNNPVSDKEYLSFSFLLTKSTSVAPYGVAGSFKQTGVGGQYEAHVTGYISLQGRSAKETEEQTKALRSTRQIPTQDVFFGTVAPGQEGYTTTWVRPCRLNGEATPYLFSQTDSIIFGTTPLGTFIGVAYPAAQDSTDRLYRTIVIPGVTLLWENVEKVFDRNACDTETLWSAALSLVPPRTAYSEVLVERYTVNVFPANIPPSFQIVNFMLLSMWDNAPDLIGLAGVYYFSLPF